MSNTSSFRPSSASTHCPTHQACSVDMPLALTFDFVLLLAFTHTSSLPGCCHCDAIQMQLKQKQATASACHFTSSENSNPTCTRVLTVGWYLSNQCAFAMVQHPLARPVLGPHNTHQHQQCHGLRTTTPSLELVVECRVRLVNVRCCTASPASTPMLVLTLTLAIVSATTWPL